MKFTISENKSQIQISISDSGQPDKILDSLNECREGRCICKTDEYKKIKDLKIQSDSEKISITILPLEGESMNKSEIEKCLKSIDPENSEKSFLNQPQP